MLALATTSAPSATSSADASSQRPVTLNLPPALSDQVVQALKADPRAVPLRDQSAHFYGLGTRMLDVFDERELSAVLRRTFVVRAGEVGLHARKAGGEDGSGGSRGGGGGEEFLRGLDEWERGLFRRAHDGGKRAREWMDNVKKH